MRRRPAYLTNAQAAAVYDRIGRWQDTQAFYESPAVEEMVRSGDFEQARSVVEVGCGTGALAERLLSRHLPEDATYLGLDVSSHMVSLAGDRVRPWTDRARIVGVDGHSPWPIEDHSCDRVVATYVLDLLSPEAIATFFAESARVLRTDGMVAVTSLSPADRGAAHLLSEAWMRLFSVDPRLTAGCRPLVLADHLPAGWHTIHRDTFRAYGLRSSVLIASHS
jgi:ubiquinone/menaquinone biosynthesis C-methylase UbiE